MVGNLVEVRTGILPNTSRNRYRLRQLLAPGQCEVKLKAEGLPSHNENGRRLSDRTTDLNYREGTHFGIEFRKVSRAI